ncbi:MAG: site-specific DNA-methyltransferase [Selenomonadaceae bacterium]|nr:site-specific DNA-methyltransferase [Selenomonadaceae bacterium]
MPTLNWLGKDKVVNFAAQVPCHALDFKYNFGGGTGNKIIHGDNLLALKSLLPLYEGRVKCIYIDPPYNTGNEGWVYNDNVNSPQIQKWLGQVVGREGEDYSRHDKWLCMMYPRLKLLKQLLSDDGAIFISIDDNEQNYLRDICEEIFGRQNFLAQVIWERAYAPVNLKKHFSTSHDYLICYAKNISQLVCHGLPRSNEADKRYKNPDNDPRGLWKASDLSVGPIVESKVYEITTPSGRKVFPPKGYCWRLDKETFQKYVEENKIWFGEDGDNVPSIKRFLSEVKQSVTPMTIWKYSEVGHSQDATKALKEIFDGQAVFTYPKPVDLIKRCLELYSDKNSIVLDAFAGSGTTAHAVLNLNAVDGGDRKFILVEMEPYAETITAERVRRIGGSFDYYEVGAPLFVEGDINPAVDIEQIRGYVWAMETRTPYVKPNVEDCAAFMGVDKGTAYYFYEGALDSDFLATMRTRADSYVIFAESCAVGEEFLRRYGIEFKKIPRDIVKIWVE